MESVFDFFKNIFDLINNENYINLISIVVVAFTTYFVTKYTVLKPNRLSIKQSQLEHVYLPLFLLLSNMDESISRSSALAYYKKISNILDKNYVLVFPQLHQLASILKKNIVDDLGYNKTLHDIKYQVSIDYELLKRSLGYPSGNFHDIFIRMTPKKKLECLIPWIDAFWLFIPCFIIFIFREYLPVHSFLTLLLLLLLVLLFSFIVRLFKHFVSTMND